MKRLFAPAALMAMVIASPAMGQSRDNMGAALALMRVAPTICGTELSDVAAVNNAFKLIAQLKGWRLADLEGSRAKVQDQVDLEKPDLCETVSRLVDASRKIAAPRDQEEVVMQSPPHEAVAADTEAPPETTAAPAGAPIAEIKAKCVGEWPGDYEMQNYCIDKQVEAWTKVEQF